MERNSMDIKHIRAIGNILNNDTKPLKQRFRALFTLRNIAGPTAIDCISSCFSDSSELLKHECAFCLGQMKDDVAIPILVELLKDQGQSDVVRHEAGEALGAIGNGDILNLLEEYSLDPVKEVAETCQIASNKLRWLQKDAAKEEGKLPKNPFCSEDPAPPSQVLPVDVLRDILLKKDLPMFERYRAMFALRNMSTKEAALVLAEGLKCEESALFRHEVAYVLGQMEEASCVKQLIVNLQDQKEHPMVRHECAEALGAIATEECIKVLEEYSKDSERIVRESCEVALDMCDYANSAEFQYADAVSKVIE